MSRLTRLRAAFTHHGIDAMVINKPENRRYLSGFTGTAASLMIDAKNAYIYTDFRYVEQAKEQCPGFQVVQVGDDYYQKLSQHIHQAGVTKLGFETSYITHATYQKMTQKLFGIEMVPVKDIVEQLRVVKDRQELQLVEQAVAIADQGWQQIIKWFQDGVTEGELSLQLEFIMRQLGAESRAFDFIVASGTRGALPHGVASDKPIMPGEMVTIDFGAVYHGYHSDITRNFVVGNPTQKQRDIYNIVLEAQLAGIEAVKPGIPASVVDLTTRGIIEHHGYAEYFGHSTGHGVGLAIHEEPRVSFQSETILQPGMLFTVEPGIYLPGWGGVRIEDTVLVTAQGCRVLTQASKELLCI